MTPATFGAMACMIKKFWGSSLAPTIWQTRAESGTADTPAAPMMGLILFLLKRFMALADNTPAAVAMAKAAAPRTKISKESGVRNLEASVEVPTVKPKSMVTMSIKAVRAVFANRSVTPAFLKQIAEKKHA